MVGAPSGYSETSHTILCSTRVKSLLAQLNKLRFCKRGTATVSADNSSHYERFVNTDLNCRISCYLGMGRVHFRNPDFS